MRNSKRHSIDKTKCVNTKKTIPFQFFITMKKNLFRKFLALFLTETEKEMQAVQDAAIEKDLQKLDSLTHHLRSSWEVLRADQPLRELYGLLHGDTLPDGEALSRAVTAVLEKGAEIIRLAEKERRKYEDG